MRLYSVGLGLVNRICVGSILLPVGIMIPDHGYVNVQITSDDSLNTTVYQNGNSFTIANGSILGSNLSYSFGQFFTLTGGSASFELN
ncbi:hypothetical protein [Calothrix sp. NIES-2098]|uniref:hypothetical protein n=1 Tax=Calothrix sp. NIES-2098 TaxID=1954171 RepID=UPI000B5E0F4A|nr:hypothetical protein NIES2098_70240 [Calothrix sp. NIES-2098]